MSGPALLDARVAQLETGSRLGLLTAIHLKASLTSLPGLGLAVTVVVGAPALVSGRVGGGLVEVAPSAVHAADNIKTAAATAGRVGHIWSALRRS